MKEANHERQKPSSKDMDDARKEWELANPGKEWNDLRTQTKNRLAKEQMSHRNYSDLCKLIMQK